MPKKLIIEDGDFEIMGDTINADEILENLLNNSNSSKQKSTDQLWFKNLKVGDDVLYLGDYWFEPNLKAKIIKINAKSITIQFYNYDTIFDSKARRSQTYGKDILIWTNLNQKKRTVFSKHKIGIQGEHSFIDRELIQGEKQFDFGR